MADTIDRKMMFIETRLYWEGKINRKDLQDYFNISIPQASADIKKYIDIAGENIIYDSSAKNYIPTNQFEPKYITKDYSYYFDQLLISNNNIVSRDSFLGKCPDFYSLQYPLHTLEPDILKSIVQAIINKKLIEIEYRSIVNPTPHSRLIAPHAFGFDGFRWHLRAYCCDDNKFKDYTLSRIRNTKIGNNHSINFAQDIMWHNTVTFIIGPNPKLNKEQKELIEIEYGMTDGELRFEVRSSFAFYARERLHLQEGHENRAPKEQHIILKNSDEIIRKIEFFKEINIEQNI